MQSVSTAVPFACVGAVGGAAAAILLDAQFVPVLAPTTAILCALLGVMVGGRRLGWAITIPLVPFAGAVNGALAAAIAVHDASGVGAAFGLAFSTPFLVVLPPLAYVASLDDARPGSLAQRVGYARLVSATTLACSLVGACALGRPMCVATDQPLAVVVGIVIIGGALVSMITILVLTVRAHEALRTVPLLRASEPGTSPGALRDASFVDLGLGTTLHVYLDPSTLLRSMPAARVMYEGDPQPVARRASRALVWSLVSLVVALACCAMAAARCA